MRFDALSHYGNPVGHPTIVLDIVCDPGPLRASDSITSKPITCKTVQRTFALCWLLIQFLITL